MTVSGVVVVIGLPRERSRQCPVCEDPYLLVQELECHLFALIVLVAGGYTLREDGHVRVDIVYRSRWVGDRGRAWIDLLGIFLFLMPFCLLVIWASMPFVAQSFSLGEGSPDPGGLPYRFLLKAAIPVGFMFLLLQGFAMAVRSVQRLRGSGVDAR